MIKVTVANACKKLFVLQRGEFNFGHTGNKWDDVKFERVSSDLCTLLILNEPVTLTIEGELDCVLHGYLKTASYTIGGFVADITFAITSVTIEEQDDYKKAYDRAMAIVKR